MNCRKLSVAHIISGSLKGGAARGALALHNALKAEGINSIIINNYPKHKKTLDFSNILNLISYRLVIFLESVLWVKLFKSKSYFSLGLFEKNNNIITELKKVDIIHVHWSIGIISLLTLRKIKKPIVWTIRDMWTFTGGCHYSLNCLKYSSSCNSCPILKTNFKYDISYFLYKFKEIIFRKAKNITFVGISNWITKEALNSKILNGQKIKTIYNITDGENFKILSKESARDELNLPKNKFIILFGAVNINQNGYKGGNIIKEVFQHFEKDSDIFFISFGSNIYPNSQNLKNFGFIDDRKKLNNLYSSADVFLMPSLQEAFGKTALESIYSGTPVINFANTGAAEIIDDRKTGFIVEEKSSKCFIEGINFFRKNQKHIKLSSFNRSNRSLKKFSKKNIAIKYINLYKKIYSESINKNSKEI